MNKTSAETTALDTVKPTTIAIMAMGGQGGGVLVDWIVALCEAQGWVAQSTSVPGVAQRTGATIYYIETLPLPQDAPAGLRPVLSLLAVPGELDIVIGAELMEAGRAIQLGLVTPDRTTLIASSHRAYAVIEKQVPGDGIRDAEAVFQAARACARQFIAFDMMKAAEQTGSALSAVLFGALAATKALPFPPEAFEAAIRNAGIGVEASLRAFALGLERGTTDQSEAPPQSTAGKRLPALAPIGNAAFDALASRARAEFPPATHRMIAAGLQRVVDFQDVTYGAEYLDLLAGVLLLDDETKGYALTITTAKYLAVAMAYDDVYRVADLKTRASRFERVRTEVAAASDQLVNITEFMHPRMEEVLGALPTGLAHFIERRSTLRKSLNRFVDRGRRVKTNTLFWFLSLYALAGLKRFRRGTMRHAIETRHRDAWLSRVKAAAANDYALGVELASTRRLIKGYSDTHARGESKFDRVMAAATRLEGRPDAADWVRRLNDAALRDEKGDELTGTLKTIDSFL